MFDFYLIASVIVNIFMFLKWSDDGFDSIIKMFLLGLSITGVIVIINTYHLIK
jgi:hypothetical protein